MKPETMTATPPSATSPLLDVSDLHVSTNTPDGRVRILAGVSLRIASGEALGLVGESGSGKSTTARAIMGILPTPPFQVDSGTITFDGRDLLGMGSDELNTIRGRDLTMIFQDPNTSLNPVYTIGDQMEAAILWQGRSGRLLGVSRQRRLRAREHAAELLDQVRLPAPRQIMQSYAFQLSGGMRQRVLIAMALLNDPKLIVADEPGSALDVTVQDQILELLESLLVGRGLSLLFISHNLGIARRVTQRVAVMYAGQVVETAATRTLFERPLHPYAQGLLASVPKLSGGMAKGIAGRMPDIADPPSGCRFHPRCPFRMEVCERVTPPLVEVEPGRAVACHLYPAPAGPL
jgi:peptide/nickel transport system ATP-binding protein